MLSLIVTIISLPIATSFYEGAGGDKNTAEKVKIATWYLIIGVILSFTLFFKTINQDYLGTFTSTITSRDYVIANFREADSDEKRAGYSIMVSRRLWKSIENEVRVWVINNWSEWEEEKPKWLSDRVRTMIPLEFLPTMRAKEKEKSRRIMESIKASGKNSQPLVRVTPVSEISQSSQSSPTSPSSLTI